MDGILFSQVRELTVFSLLRLKCLILEIIDFLLIFLSINYFYLKGTILVLMDNSADYTF